MDYTSAFISMLIILGTFGNIFIFEGILNSLGVKDNEKKKAIRKAYLFAYLIWIPVYIFGLEFLKFFGISLPAFAIAGSILLFYIGMEILVKDIPASARLENNNKLEEVVITPMAVPLLTGPGVITTTLIYRSYNLDPFLLFIVFSLAFLVSFVIVYNGNRILSKVDKKVILVLNRISAIMLLAISVELFIHGLKIIVTT